MASEQEIINRVRLELGDIATSFDISTVGNGTATRFETGTYPIDGTSLTVTLDGTQTDDVAVEERTGIITFDQAPVSGQVVRFQGIKYRYFGSADFNQFIMSALAEQTHNRTDDYGKPITLANLPAVEVYPLSLLITIKALWALAIDAAFDIDISAPDGVSIPRSERYRQLMEMIQGLQAQYDTMAEALNIGLGRIEVLEVRRVSGMTGRLVPQYIEQEIEDNTPPIRIHLPVNTFGTDPVEDAANALPPGATGTRVTTISTYGGTTSGTTTINDALGVVLP